MLSCDVNAAAWGAKNRVKLFPGQLQRWTWVTRASRDESERELADEATSRTRYYFANAGGLSSAADSFNVERIARTPPPIRASYQRREKLDPAPLVESGSDPLVWITLTFALRTVVPDGPWPVYSSLWDRGSSECPIGATWVLDSADDVSAGVAPPEPKPVIERVLESAGNVAEKTGVAVASTLTKALWVAAAAAGIYAVHQSGLFSRTSAPSRSPRRSSRPLPARPTRRAPS